MTHAPDATSEFDAVELFLNASELNAMLLPRFIARLQSFEPTERAVHPLARSHAPVPLPHKRDSLDRTFASRRSDRHFDSRPMRVKELSQALSALSVGPDNRPLVPTAGALELLTIHVALHHTESEMGRVVARYLPREHSLVAVEDLPPPKQLRRLLGLQEPDIPHATVLFGIRLDEVMAKYGARGARFALIAIGQAAQNLALRIAHIGLGGYQLGGVCDQEWDELCELGDVARTSHGYGFGPKGT